MKSVADRLVRRISHKGRGSSFTAKDFLDLGSRASVDMALSALARSGRIRRVCRGVYDYPRQGELLSGDLAPDVDEVAHAIARKTGARIQPSGAVAANMLGLSDQVPAKVVYLSDHLSRTVEFGSQTITFQTTHPKELLRNRTSGRVVQALLFLGREAVTNEVIDKLMKILTPAQRKRLVKDARYTLDWIADVARRIADEGEHG